ncbi:class I SAM-dependent methyltransferase [Nitrospirillum iridis]|uniref:SAM-dependent methyltransferase n=1 Tax=Nitrospirillum iridis TaxID=765888 RepID=A0A7X0EGG4_9PROT|nr:class I SAM-dependent methyltransferase [Nitrospirillum iridis]MBB6253559.1 SAM-dependent methyltransferase [Nitrospirillum iridis]
MVAFPDTAGGAVSEVELPSADAQPLDRGLRARWRRARFMAPADIGLFLRSAKTDGAIGRWRGEVGQRAAFENAYGRFDDPWASGSDRYRYQGWKYDRIVDCLPAGRRFSRALDLGCGLGLLSTRLAARADAVVGMDIAQAAVDRAAIRSAAHGNVSFRQGDVLDLPRELDGQFDLVVIADTLYYLPPPLTPATLKGVAARVADLLAPGGVCLLANHYFFAADPDSRLSRRIHDAFTWSPRFHQVRESRRPFYLVSLLDRLP